MPNKTVRCALHLEHQFHPSVPDQTRPNLEDQLENPDLAKVALGQGIDRIGVRLSYGESRALFAVQRLLDETGYRGNAKPDKLKAANPQKFDGDLPILLIEKSDFLDAYGVTKAKTRRGKMEYSAQARRAALRSLSNLASHKFLFSYERKFETENDSASKEIQFIGNLLAIQEIGRNLRIVPQTILVDQIDSYYLPKPADLFINIAKGRDVSLIRFMEWLLLNYEMIRRRPGNHKYQLRRQSIVVAYAIGLEGMISRYEKKAIRERLTRYYELAKKAGYLKSYETDAAGSTVDKLDILQLNAPELAKLHASVVSNTGKV
jgi:hypothetical protein